MGEFLDKSPDLIPLVRPAFDLGKVIGMKADEQLARFDQLIRCNQSSQCFDVLYIGRIGDEAAGVAEQFAAWIQFVQPKIFLAWHQPFFSKITIIGRDATDVDPPGRPIRALDKFPFLRF
jgi:hypothetical protein